MPASSSSAPARSTRSRPCPPNQAASIKSSGQNVEIVTGQSTLLIPMNEKVKPFQDKNVRLALAYAIDRDAIAKDVYFGLAPPAKSPLPSGTLFYKPNWPIPYDLDKAKKSLAASSVPNGFSFTLTVPAGNLPLASVAQIWAEQPQEDRHHGEDPADRGADRVLGLARPEVRCLHAARGRTTLPTRWSSQGWPSRGRRRSSRATRVRARSRLRPRANPTLNPAKRQAVYSRIQSIMAQDEPQIYVVDLPYPLGVVEQREELEPNAQGDYSWRTCRRAVLTAPTPTAGCGRSCDEDRSRSGLGTRA